MCGVVSIVYKKNNQNLGKEASFLLKKLEYRGYDSTGAGFFQEKGDILLKKKVGAPSVVTAELEIDKRTGQKFIGQVRWATYGAVTDDNAQPHEVNCLTHMLGAHNGNISNTDTLKEFLMENNHQVISDNDGEMLVHTIEHYYSQILHGAASSIEQRVNAMKSAIRKAQLKVRGSYAACVSVPDIPGVFAIKSGSSLYAGKGVDAGGDFIVVSSDLTSVLSKTRFLIPLAEGEGIYFDHNAYTVFSLAGKAEHTPRLRRSRLNISDIALQPKYHYFMEQEIHSTAANLQPLIKYYLQDKSEKELHRLLEKNYPQARKLLYDFVRLYNLFDPQEMASALNEILQDPEFQNIKKQVQKGCPAVLTDDIASAFTSEEATLLNELLGIAVGETSSLQLLDQMIIWKKKRTILKYKEKTIELFKEAKQRGRRVFIVASGTSYHAGLTAGYFMSKIAGLAVIPANPGMFRSNYLSALSDNDLVIGVSQSGETKDLVDIFNDIRKLYGDKIHLITMVNNENSTLPQEKSDYYLPILCGTEIAVAATKSFISQITLFYLLALHMVHDEPFIRGRLENICHYIDFTLKKGETDITEVALRLFMTPSMHILGTSLIGIAKEGALKIREVVLNHTEGYDSAEFKHGPNTILGKNTLFSFYDLENLHTHLLGYFETLRIKDFKKRDKMLNYLQLIKDFKFSDFGSEVFNGIYDNESERHFFKEIYDEYRASVNIENMFSNYPLIFVCPPVERDKRITITQIHTHKIRGADIILIAEFDEELKKAVEGVPAESRNYYSKYIQVPKTGDRHIFVFEASLVLQLLALKMSIAKRKFLNRNHVENHGVHPDVPKNVSKSITVD